MPISKDDDHVYDLAYGGEDPAMLRAVAETIEKLPEAVRQFALDRCYFVSVGRTTHGLTLPGRIGIHAVEKRSRNVWIIVLSETIRADDLQSVVAHEIAHAWRGDDRLAFAPDDCEVKTAELVKAWGFTGTGADVDFHRETS